MIGKILLFPIKVVLWVIMLPIIVMALGLIASGVLGIFLFSLFAILQFLLIIGAI